MKLAVTLGWCSVEEMLEGLPYRELLDWIAFYSTEPFPQEREDIRFGQLMSLLANINRDPSKQRELKPSDFIPEYWEDGNGGDTAEQIQRQLQATALLINSMAGGEVVRKPKHGT